ncbi:MAG: pitrilysin family protein [Chloroflexota bacterium]
MSTTVDPQRDGPVVAERPSPGAPRPYEFPVVTARRLPNGLSIMVVDLPGRPLVSATMVVTGGAAEEPAELAGATVLTARALTEGTERYEAIALVEAAERLGASLHAEAGWDALTVGVDVPAARLAPALELAAEVLLHPSFPESEVERLRDERLNDLLQVRADPRRRVDEAFVGTIYAPESPYHRPSGGTRETVERLGSADLRRVYWGTIDPGRATLVIGGDLGGQDVLALAERLFGDWTAAPGVAGADAREIVDTGSSVGRIVRVIHRPGSVQTEIRIGHRGLPRLIEDFHAVSVMSAILGGLFNSRLNMKLREEKGYTYGAGAGFDMRRAAGPFAARVAVNTEVTVPAILDTIAELDRMRAAPVAESELAAARDFLIGVFPLRFETAGAVVGALGSLAVYGLGVEELIGYRRAIESVGIDDISAAAAAHLHVSEAAIVLVGDVDAFGPDLEAVGLGRISIERDEPPIATGPIDEVTVPGPVDDENRTGPTAGAEEPAIPGIDTEPAGPEPKPAEIEKP